MAVAHAAAPPSVIPSCLDDLTATWVTSALRACQTIAPFATVESIDVQQLGQGEGFLGELGRVQLTYAEGDQGPASVIAKFPSPIPANRALGVVFAGYEKEIRTYTELAPHFTVRIPQCYFGECEDLTRGEAFVQRVIARLPDKITARLMGGLMQQAGKSERRFGLLMEDLGDARVGDQVSGSAPGDAEVALRALARMHASFWESPQIDRPWLTPLDEGVALQHAIYRRAWPVFEARFRAQLTPGARTMSDWVDAHGPELIRRLAHSPRTLLHGDYRADNIVFHDDPDGGDPTVTIIDFQAVTTGNPMIDVAYFLRGNMNAEDADVHEQRLVDAYHGELVAAGVRDYPLEDCRGDYVLGQLWVMHRGVLLIGTLDLSHERGIQMVDSAVTRALHGIDRIDLDAVRL